MTASSRRRALARLLACGVAGIPALGIPAARDPAAGITAEAPSGIRTRFALLGDTPSSSGEAQDLAQVLQALPRRDASFAVHVGDIKSGIESCDDALLSERIALLDDAPLPLVLLPGDNDWTDCHRLPSGAYDPVERLEHLRALLHAHGPVLGRDGLSVRVGTPLPENLSWQSGPCQFITLNVPGSGDGTLAPVSPRWLQARARANLADLHAAEAAATIAGLPCLVVALHANTGLERMAAGNRGGPHEWINTAIAELADRFAGTVLLLHGDGHRFIDDHPLAAAKPAVSAGRRRLRRVQSFGSPASRRFVMIEIGAEGSGVSAPVRIEVAAERL